jgi:hypothetical protein
MYKFPTLSISDPCASTCFRIPKSSNRRIPTLLVSLLSQFLEGGTQE